MGYTLGDAMKERYQNQIELLQGTLDMLILQTLQWGPRHGYALSQSIRTNSGRDSEGGYGLALSGVASDGKTEIDFGGMESVGEQSADASVSVDGEGEEAACVGAFEMGAAFGCDRGGAESCEE